MRTFRIGSAAMWLLALITAAAADTVTLKNGRIIRGTIEAEEADSILIKYMNERGTITLREKIARRDIASITKEDLPAPASRPTATAAAKAEDEEEDVKPEVIADKPKFLSRAIDRYEAKRYRYAGIDFTKLIQSSTEKELEELSAKAQEAAQKPLAELAADSHLQDALERARGGPIRLMYVTPYEAEALVKLLESEYQKAMGKEVELPGAKAANSAAKKPAAPAPPPAPGRGPRQQAKNLNRPPEEPAAGPVSLVINNWIDKPKDFSGKAAESRAFLKHIQHTMSLLDAMMRYDAKAKSDAATKDRYVDSRKKLDALRVAVTERMAGGLTPAEKKKLEEEEAQYRQKMIEEQIKYERWIMLRNQARDKD